MTEQQENARIAAFSEKARIDAKNARIDAIMARFNAELADAAMVASEAATGDE